MLESQQSHTRQAARGISCQAGEQQVGQAVELDLVLHAEALEALPRVKQIPVCIGQSLVSKTAAP